MESQSSTVRVQAVAWALAACIAIGATAPAEAQELAPGFPSSGPLTSGQDDPLHRWQEIGMGLQARVVRLRDEVAGLTVQVLIQNPTETDVRSTVVSVALRGRSWDHNGHGGKLGRRNSWVGSDSRYLPLIAAGGRVIVEFGPTAYRDIPSSRVTEALITAR